MLVLTIVGARPQLVKCALVSKELRKNHTEVLVHTGQHYDSTMSEVFFVDLDIPTPDVNLKIQEPSINVQLGRMLVKLHTIMKSHTPDVVLVYGDTTSTLAGALAAKTLNIPVAHVEAGCRSGDKAMPEEVNRYVVDYVSTLHFCASVTCMNNLCREGIQTPIYTGDVMVDMIDTYRHQFECEPKICDDDYILLTLHRPSNTDNKQNLQGVLNSVGQLSTQVVFPIHPRTQKMMHIFGTTIPSNVMLVDPLGYIGMLGTLNNAVHVVTDSGGVQKEAYTLGVPCTTVRNTTEWPETLVGGWNVLTDPTNVCTCVMRNRPSGHRPKVFGSGDAVRNVVDHLEAWYGTDGTTN